MPTLLLIICFFAVYGVFAMASDIGKRLKRIRKAQEAQQEAQKIIDEEYEREKRESGN